MSKKTITIVIVILFVIIFFIGLRFLSGEDDWICQNGEWVKHGQPAGPPPSLTCE